MLCVVVCITARVIDKFAIGFVLAAMMKNQECGYLDLIRINRGEKVAD